MKALIILLLLICGWAGNVESADKKDKDAKPTTEEVKKHDDLLEARGINLSCLKLGKNKTNEENAKSIKSCIDGLPK